MAVSESERRRAWVLAGGRCVVCNKYLLEGRTSRELFLGELAHIVGQKESAKSPRGQADLSQYQRDSADNLMLLCADDHDEVDDTSVLDLATIELLTELKREHEAAIKQATGFRHDRRSVVLRMVANVRDQVFGDLRDVAATAVIRSGSRLPQFDLAYDRFSIEIDLRKFPEEAEGTREYIEAAIRSIDAVIKGKLREGVAANDVPHLSVFAIARWPLLVYLGTKLDDTIPTDVYQLHRATNDWAWPLEPPAAAIFEVITPAQRQTPEAVLLLNISGTIHVSEIPAELRALPIFTITAGPIPPHPDVMSSAAVLGEFEAVLRRLLAGIESETKATRTLHVLAAIPLSAAVALGRVRDPNVHPALVLYERTGNEYVSALEIR